MLNSSSRASIEDRKDSHLRICLQNSVDLRAPRSNGFSAFRFDHDALPEVDFDSIRLETSILGKRLAAPLVVGAMTGGTPHAAIINRRLAWACEHHQIGLALGSQRKMLDPRAEAAVIESFDVRRTSPGIPLLFGNIGAVQLNYGATARQIRELIERIGCDAFNFHLNPLQEAIQPEGDRQFSGLLARLGDCIPRLGVPVLFKEVGAGISTITARKLRTLPIAGVETAGVGGTSWSEIEGLRSGDRERQAMGSLFSRWGITTAESLQVCRRELPDAVLIASGGIRNGIDVAKAIALGASAVALALPFLKAAAVSAEEAAIAISQVMAELRTVLFVTGVRSIDELRLRGPELLRPTYDQNE